jgi:1,5-anhydro-D-fructose reductase (1,5-anhydro-D-mannitol-forming)
LSPPFGAPVRLGVAGCARILPAHLRGLQALRAADLDLCRVTALCARTLDDAATFRLRGEGPPPRPPASDNPRDPLGAPHLYVSDVQAEPLPELFDDWRLMVESDLVDAVLILAPVQLHHEIALAALEAGKHVLIEKPFAITVRAGLAIATEAKRRGLVAGVAENLRYSETSRALGWVLEQGLIGTPQLWLSAGLGGEWAPDRIVAHTPWRHRKLEGGGGPAVDGAVHLMHQIRYVMGPVEEVYGMARTLEPERVDRDAEGRVVARVSNELEDVYVAQLRFASGALGSVMGGWGGRGEGTSLDGGPVVYGSRGCVKGGTVIGDDGSRQRALDLLDRDAATELKERFFPSDVRDAFGLELLDFFRAITLGTPLEDTADEGVMDLAMAYAVLESSAAGRPVRLEEVMSGAANVYQAEIDEHYGI